MDERPALYSRLSPCTLCPRKCKAVRSAGEVGFCGVDAEVRVAAIDPHHGEEPCLSGPRGSGTVFLCGCNLGCVFCQNADISRHRRGEIVGVPELATGFLSLQGSGCHNINLVTPTHYAPQLVEAITRSRELGLTVPVVWNCGGYEDYLCLKELDGVVDIYLSDYKFDTEESGACYAQAPDYWDICQDALREMHRQVGDLELDDDGIATRGLIVRHLVMPELEAESESIIDFLAGDIGPGTAVNIMAQYRPQDRASVYPEINRRVDPEVVDRLQLRARAAGLRLVG